MGSAVTQNVSRILSHSRVFGCFRAEGKEKCLQARPLCATSAFCVLGPSDRNYLCLLVILSISSDWENHPSCVCDACGPCAGSMQPGPSHAVSLFLDAHYPKSLSHSVDGERARGSVLTFCKFVPGAVELFHRVVYNVLHTFRSFWTLLVRASSRSLGLSPFSCFVFLSFFHSFGGICKLHPHPSLRATGVESVSIDLFVFSTLIFCLAFTSCAAFSLCFRIREP